MKNLPDIFPLPMAERDIKIIFTINYPAGMCPVLFQ
jgi:hypothetical protein